MGSSAMVTVGAQNRLRGHFGEHAVAVLGAAAGLSIATYSLDIGTDLGLAGPTNEIRLQVKTTTGLNIVDDAVRYALDVDAYDYLREETTVHRYLVVMETVGPQTDWVASTRFGSLIRRSAYVTSLRGMAPTTNTATITVSLPLDNIVTAASLRYLVEGDDI